MSLSLLRALFFTDPLIILATVLMGSLSVICSVFDPGGRRQHAISRRWARMLLALSGARVRVQGLERLDPGRSYVFAGNHLSLMDTPVVLGSIPHQFLFLVNAKYVRLPFLGTHLRRAGHFAVDSDNVRASLKILTEAARVIREQDLSVMLFPEGSRARGGLQEFKEGAAYIAIKAGVPVVPFALRGTREILPIGSVHVRGGPVELIIGEPVASEGWSLKNREEFTRLMRERVAVLLEHGLDAPQTAAREAVL